MARILVQTNDCLTVLDERHVRLADMHDSASPASLLTRLGRAIQDADSSPPRRTRAPARHATVVAAATDYREVSG